MIKIEVHSTRAVIRSQEPLTVGLRGAKVRFSFGEPWENLIKTVVFRQGEKTVTVADISAEVTVPWEVLTVPGLPVLIGVYGTDGGQVAIPTVWTATQPVHPGADPEGDPSAEPTPGLWEQMQGKLGSLEELHTADKSSLVAAINEANRPVCLIYVFGAADGTYAADHSADEIQSMLEAKVPVACYWYDKSVLLHPSEYQLSGAPYVFTAVSGEVEYTVVIGGDGVSCTTEKLAKKSDIPTMTSELTNDSGFLTDAPVKSVNGQTGDVELKPPLYMVTIDSSGRRTEQSFSEIVEAYRLGYIVQLDYLGRLLPLGVVNDTECQFYEISDATSTIVTVRTNSIIAVHERTLASKADIPQKVSELENDSGYLTSVPVTSVNGQTGDVTISAHGETVLYVPQDLTPEQKAQARQNIGAIEAPDAASVGQTIVVKEVDENGKPTQWEAVDLPANGSSSSNSGVNADTSGKKWLFVGDSITEHNFRATKNYDQFLSEWLGIESINRGMSSTGVTHSLTSSPTWLTDLANYPTDVDCVSVMGALNDRHTPLGEWGDRDTNTVYGGVWNYFNNLITKYPNTPIIYITSTPREYSYGVDGEYTAWVDAFIKTAHHFSIPVLDLYRESGLRPWNATNNATYFSCDSAPNGDGVHPNALGQELIARKIYDFAKVHLFGLVISGSSGGDDDGRIIDVGVWESGTLSAGVDTDSTSRIRTGFIDVTDCASVVIQVAEGYAVGIHDYLYENNLSCLHSSDWVTGAVEHNCSSINYIRIVVKSNDETDITPDAGSNAILSVAKYGTDTHYEPDAIDLGDWELGAIQNSAGNVASSTRLRTVNYIDITGYEKITVKFDESVYKVAVYFYDTADATQSLNTPSYNNSGYFNILNGLSENAKYMRLVLARVDGGEMNVEEASALTAF